MNIKLLRENARIPTRGSEFAAGYDLYAAPEKVKMPDGSEAYEKIEIPPHQTAMIPTGIAIAIDNNFWGGVYARSGLATKSGLRPANCVGVIDPDYRGEIFVALHNDTDNFAYVNAGDRIAQLIFHPRFMVDGWNQVVNLDETQRQEGGFGSTGSN